MITRLLIMNFSPGVRTQGPHVTSYWQYFLSRYVHIRPFVGEGRTYQAGEPGVVSNEVCWVETTLDRLGGTIEKQLDEEERDDLLDPEEEEEMDDDDDD